MKERRKERKKEIVRKEKERKKKEKLIFKQHQLSLKLLISLLGVQIANQELIGEGISYLEEKSWVQ